MQHITVKPCSISTLKRSKELIPPPDTESTPRRWAASKANQKPRNGPKLNGKNARSLEPTPACLNTSTQPSVMADQLSGVSNHRMGAPWVPLVWWQRV